MQRIRRNSVAKAIVSSAAPPALMFMNTWVTGFANSWKRTIAVPLMASPQIRAVLIVFVIRSRFPEE